MEKKYIVTFARVGSTTVFAESAEEAMRIANEDVKLDEVYWADDWPATDAIEVDDDDFGAL